MVFEIIIPAIAESITEVTISALLVSQGSFVEENQGILELETEKVNQLIYAPCKGIVSWNVKPGDVMPVGSVVGSINEKSEEHVTRVEEVVVFENNLNNEGRSGDAEIIEIPIINQGPPITGKFVPLKDIKTLKDEAREKMSSIRKTIAKRLVDSLRTTAMLTTFNEINMDPIIKIRTVDGEKFRKKMGVKLGFMSFFIKAVVDSLKEFPKLNAYLEGDDIVYRKYYDIGIAVGTEKGLLVPVLRDCDKLSQGQIELQLADLAERARNGKVLLGELEGGGFTITNAGIYGSLLSTPILNPPQVGILGMHRIQQRPVVIDNEIKIANMMYVALSYDHRIIDGKDAVSFVMKVKAILENPEFVV